MQPVRVDVHRRDDDPGGRRARHADEITTVAPGALDVEARQSKGGRTDVDEPGPDAQTAERLAAPPSEDEITRVRERFLLNSPFVLYAGNIKPHKNIDRLIEAFSILRRHGAGETKLLLIGDEISKYPNLRRLVHRFQLHQYVRFLGFVPDATLAALTIATTAHAQPKRDPGEIHGLKLGLKADEMSTDTFGDLACGSNGGPPRQFINDWSEFSKCRPEPSGLYEVNTRRARWVQGGIC